MGRGNGGGGGNGSGAGGNARRGSGGLADGLTFERTASQVRNRFELVLADVAKLDASLATDPVGARVGPGGTGNVVPGRYPEAQRFLARARAEGIAVHPTQVGVSRNGTATIDDGSHRFAALRDSGATALPVAVQRGQVARFNRLFGVRP